MKFIDKILGKAEPKPTLTATLKRESANLYVLRIGGLLNKATVSNIEAVARRDIDGGAQDLKMLLILQDDFLGWERAGNWGDVDFFAQYGDHIVKIAVVGDTQWEAQVLAFLGAGSRKGEVRFFHQGKDAEARSWLVAP
ncbi:MAG: STAS/SEC14 domain-containing protein [bacterium]